MFARVCDKTLSDIAAISRVTTCFLVLQKIRIFWKECDGVFYLDLLTLKFSQRGCSTYDNVFFNFTFVSRSLRILKELSSTYLSLSPHLVSFQFMTLKNE